MFYHKRILCGEIHKWKFFCRYEFRRQKIVKTCSYISVTTKMHLLLIQGLIRFCTWKYFRLCS